MWHEIGQPLSDILINVGGLIKKEIILHCPKMDIPDPDFVNGSWGKSDHQDLSTTIEFVNCYTATLHKSKKVRI